MGRLSGEGWGCPSFPFMDLGPGTKGALHQGLHMRICQTPHGGSDAIHASALPLARQHEGAHLPAVFHGMALAFIHSRQ